MVHADAGESGSVHVKSSLPPRALDFRLFASVAASAFLYQLGGLATLVVPPDLGFAEAALLVVWVPTVLRRAPTAAVPAATRALLYRTCVLDAAAVEAVHIFAHASLLDTRPALAHPLLTRPLVAAYLQRRCFVLPATVHPVDVVTDATLLCVRRACLLAVPITAHLTAAAWANCCVLSSHT